MRLKEHQSAGDLRGLLGESMLKICTRGFEHGRINLLQPELKNGEVAWTSYYRIGAEWLDAECTHPLVVTSKIMDIDFLHMFMTCLTSEVCAATFHGIYDIEFDAPQITAPGLDSVLTPLLLVQFLSVTEKIASKGLKKGYITREENLKTIKGRLMVFPNERRNVWSGRADRFACRYDEYSVDTPENRLIKRALLFSQAMLSRLEPHSCHGALRRKLRRSLAAFEPVSDRIEMSERTFHSRNKLYADYTRATSLARMILRRYDFNISNIADHTDTVPVFRIDMALLFEHYVYALLEQTYGSDTIIYQAAGTHGRYYADFLYVSPDYRAILDTKYIEFERLRTDDPGVDNPDSTGLPSRSPIRGGIIAQLSGYARDYSILRKLGISPTSTDYVPVVPCIILYPAVPGGLPPFDPSSPHTFSAQLHPEPNTLKFWRLPVSVPTLKNSDP